MNEQKPLKAYKLSCEDGDHGQQIVFSTSAARCRGMKPGDCCCCEYIDLHVHRAKEFDQYAPGPITIQQYLDQGWFWECSGCYKHIYEDDKPLIIDGSVYHSRECVVRARKSWGGVDPERCHESVMKAIRDLDAWLAANPDTGKEHDE